MSNQRPPSHSDFCSLNSMAYAPLSEAISSLGCRRNNLSGWFGSWLNCNLWLVLGQWNQLAIHLIQLDITGINCLHAADSGDVQLSEREMTLVSCLWTPESSLHLISPFNWISTESWLRWWYTVGWAISSESVPKMIFSSRFDLFGTNRSCWHVFGRDLLRQEEI